MVRIKSIEGVLITADDYASLIKAIGNEVDNYEGFQPKIAIADEHNAMTKSRTKTQNPGQTDTAASADTTSGAKDAHTRTDASR